MVDKDRTKIKCIMQNFHHNINFELEENMKAADEDRLIAEHLYLVGNTITEDLAMCSR